jgi:O-antigen/teichoic acid export membrane protein
MSLKRQTLWSIAPLVVVTVLNLASVPLFYRYLGADMYALWFYVINFTGAFGFMDLGLGVAVGRYIGVALGAGREEEVRELWGSGNLLAVPLLAFFALIFTGIGCMFGPAWFHLGAENATLLRASFVVAGASLFVSYYGQLWWILCQSHLEFAFLGKLRIAVVLLQIPPMILLARMTGNPFYLLAYGLAVNLLQQAVLFFHVLRRHDLGFEWKFFRHARIREMGSYTLKTFLSLVVGSFTGSIDRLLLGRLAPAAPFAAYNIASNVGTRLTILSTAIMGPVFHSTNRGIGGSEVLAPSRVYDESFRICFPWYLHVFLWLLVWQKLLLDLWLGGELALSVGAVFPWLIGAYCVTALANISSSQIASLNRIGTQIFFQLAASGLAVAALLVGWQMAGTTGAAIGFCASRVVLVFQDFYVARLVSGLGWRTPFLLKQSMLQLLAGAGFWYTSLQPVPLGIALFLAFAHGAGISLMIAWQEFRRRSN